jgi:uncharacterized protein
LILYLDTSALVKLYVTESGSTTVLTAVAHADLLATHLIAWVELRAALARKRALGEMDADRHAAIVADMEADWVRFNIVRVDEPLVFRAGELAERHSLRGYDAVHLAAAERSRLAALPLRFACFDRALTAAAATLGMDVLGAG